MTLTRCSSLKSPRRAPEQTRQRLLWAAYGQIHRYGYQGMRVSAVVESAGLQKGAFYHHFAGKRALAFAVLDEIIVDRIAANWTAALESAADPVAAIAATIDAAARGLSEKDLQLGCPLCNLAQEMSPIDNEFRQRLEAVFDFWVRRVEAALLRGQAGGLVKPDIDCARSAAFVVAALQGCITRAKAAQDLVVLQDCTLELAKYLYSLKAH